MEDYKEDAKTELLRYFAPDVDNNWPKVYHTTESIKDFLQGIFPAISVDDHFVYEVLKELNFKTEKVEDILKWVLFEK